MAERLPSRPNLDQLRTQAKELLKSLHAGDPAAARVFREHLPAAAGLSEDRIRGAGYRLADAQSAVARKLGFAAWPKLARHVEMLRTLEGTWGFESLQIEGNAVPAGATASSRILIDGDRFRTESPEAVYEGVFTIDVEAGPHAIDIDFIAGPEAGSRNRGIFQVEKDRLELCLDMTGKGRPAAFATTPGSGCAWEVLKRVSGARPDAVNGGKPAAPGTEGPWSKVAEAGAAASALGDDAFVYRPSEAFRKLEGAWAPVKLVRDGQALPAMMLSVGKREGVRNEVKVTFAGQMIVHALMHLDESATPVAVTYRNIGGAAKGKDQLGIMEWRGQEAWFCMAAPGMPRPADFEPGPSRTLSVWKKA